MSQTLTITLPDAVFKILTGMAELTYRTVDEVVLSAVETTAISPDLPGDIASELASMPTFSDEKLWTAIKPTFSEYEQSRLTQLSELDRPLTRMEEAEQATLLRAYDRSVLRRAQALALLKQRGHDLSQVLSLPSNE